MAEGAGGTKARLGSLDALRGLAALAVVIFHYTSAFDIKEHFPGYPRAIINFSGGRYGVELFFVISGFVILWSVQRVGGVGDFAWSRFSRLFPPFWASMLLVTVYVLFAEHVLNAGIGPLTFTTPQWFANVTMVPSWFGFTELDGAYWTLAVEMIFYVMIAVLMLAKLTTPRRIVPTIVTIWCIDLAANGLSFLNGMSSHNHSPNQDFTFLFLAGMALFLLFGERDRPRRDRQILWVVYWSAPIFFALEFQPVGAAVVAAIVVTMYVAVFHDLRVLHTRPLQFMGGISYSLYLVHAYPGYITLKLLLDAGWNRNLAVLVAIVQSFVLAYILNRTVEKPVTRWLRQRKPTRRRIQLAAT
jgi:peptidoglycan/LPS O-acetylase OafA/YrhL